MTKEEPLKIIGTVTSILPNALFKVEIENKHELIAHVSGKIRKNSINILLGDTVLLEMSPYDLTKARIVFRYK